jgi:hypothetical protein
MPLFGIEETEQESRYRRGCLPARRYQLARPSRLSRPAGAEPHLPRHLHRHHPSGRAYLALANYYRFEGPHDDGASSRWRRSPAPRLLDLAKLLGGLLRIVYLFSASMPGVVPIACLPPSSTARTPTSSSWSRPSMPISPANASTAACSNSPSSRASGWPSDSNRSAARADPHDSRLKAPLVQYSAKGR